MRALLTATATAALLVVLASSASASQITYDGSVLTYTAGSGEANSPIVTVTPYDLFCDPLPAPCLSIFDLGAYITVPPAQCVGGGTTDVGCALPSAIIARLGDREDSFYDWGGDTTINAGIGNDNRCTGTAATTT